jgi:hypothetical protein
MDVMNFPIEIGVCSMIGLWLSAWIGGLLRKRIGPAESDERDDLGLVDGATLTLLGLLIGFTFSMAITRYDQRKDYEEEEANAIGTEYLRAELLPPEKAATVRQLLAKFLDQRIRFYGARDRSELATISAETARLESEMWSQVKTAADDQPTTISAVAVVGMNDVLNREGYTQAAWWNRIPAAAWALMVAIAVFANLLIGYSARKRGGAMFWIVPLAVSVSFTLIADIDSPRGGLIRIHPQNLESLAQSIRAK